MIKAQTPKKPYINIEARKLTKQAICDSLCKTIQMTECGRELTALRYDQDKGIVHADFEAVYDYKQINVDGDSGWAMILDIVNHLHIG